mmetsp:Transcript_26991/g.44262  ORF Transcript_26991/g.44262 Transcript_26991/m.44262 type:complete len:285 (-) Transcript_26991:111-965(-)
MATEGIHLAKPEELLRRLVVACVQISHEDNGVWVLPLDTTQGSNDKVNCFHHNIVPLAAQWVCTCSNQCISIRFAAQRSPVNRSALREWNQITGDVLPLVSTEEDVSVIELLRGSTSGKCVDVSGDLIQAIQDGMLLMPHLWNGRNLRLHSHELINNWMNPSGQGEHIKVPGDKASWLSLCLSGGCLPFRCSNCQGIGRPSARFRTQGAASLNLQDLQVAVPNRIEVAGILETRDWFLLLPTPGRLCPVEIGLGHAAFELAETAALGATKHQGYLRYLRHLRHW